MPAATTRCVYLTSPPVVIHSFASQETAHARTTASDSLVSLSHPHVRRSPTLPHPNLPPPSQPPSAFSALSSLALDELYVLEREEAHRRAEYEVRHNEALRRLELASRLALSRTDPQPPFPHRSKSAHVSPVSTPSTFYGHGGGGYFNVSHERDDDRDRETKARRRLSGPLEPDSNPVRHHPYRTAAIHHHHHNTHTRSASPTDSEPMSAHHSPRTHPSTSPFLGPLRELSLRSALPSRVPSPVLLPPSLAEGHARRGHSAGDLAAHFGAGTPALSSGASSVGSSPGSFPSSLRTPPSPHEPAPLFLPVHKSAASSRAPSPNLAHGVRVAFGMTPIHAPPARAHWYAHPAPSRGGTCSPPIVLAPLKSASAMGSPELSPVEPRGEGAVQLPHFGEIEAAAGTVSRRHQHA